MNLQQRWSRQNHAERADAAQPASAQVFDIATGRPVAHRLKPPREWSWIARAAVSVAVMIGAIAVWNVTEMRSNPVVTNRNGVPSPVPPARIGALPAALPDSLATASPSEFAVPDAPSEAAILPAQTETVLAEPLAPGQSAVGPARRTPSSTLVFDAAAQSGGLESPIVLGADGADLTPKPDAAAIRADSRAMLTRGTQVPAVLESVIDTRMPGTVRALVGVDVRSADGRVLLVPRSSRLVGQYRSQGGRAYVIWTGLTRPDGTEQRLASPGNDGRFMARYAEAPLVSMVGDVRASSDAVRVRRGEPIRVVAARNLPISGAR